MSDRMTRDFANADNQGQLKRLIQVLGKEMSLSQNSNMRKGGLIGLSAVAIALGKVRTEESQDSHVTICYDLQDVEPYTGLMIDPILPCVTDTDARVRFYAIESLFNVTKVGREHVIPSFTDMFISIGSAVTDLDQQTRSGVESLDKLLKVPL
jgi:vacuole morphology and inheritance protein 14